MSDNTRGEGRPLPRITRHLSIVSLAVPSELEHIAHVRREEGRRAGCWPMS